VILTEIQLAIRDTVREFAQTQLLPHSAAFEAAGGYLEEFGVAKIYREFRVCQIFEGTSDIQRVVIARAL